MDVDNSIEDVYGAYTQAPTPDNLGKVVKLLKPTIGYVVASHGGADDPYVHSRAMSLAADAVQSYDPSWGTNLHTHVTNQLKQLSRVIRQSRSPVLIPERAQLDGYQLYRAQQEFVDKHGRDPDVGELADYTGLSPRRIAKIRASQIAVPSEGQVPELEHELPDFDVEAVDYVYNDADHTDRRILEMKTGYGGHPKFTPKEIAAALKLTPTQLTRRSMRLAKQLTELRGNLEKL